MVFAVKYIQTVLVLKVDVGYFFGGGVNDWINCLYS